MATSYSTLAMPTHLGHVDVWCMSCEHSHEIVKPRLLCSASINRERTLISDATLCTQTAHETNVSTNYSHTTAELYTTIIHLYRGMLACRLKVEPDVLNAQKICHYEENLCFETIHSILHNVHSQDDGQMQIQQRELLLGLQLLLY